MYDYNELFAISYVFLAMFLYLIVFMSLKKKNKYKNLEVKVFVSVALPILIIGTILDTSMEITDRFIALGLGLLVVSLNWYFYYRKI